MQYKHKSQGFTIIEVVLVLAIAGLIFLIVFLALPSLQKSQRDTQRKNDVSRFMSQLTQYQSNHQGALPTGTGLGAWDPSFVSPYLGAGASETFNDPLNSTQYAVDIKATVPATAPSASTGNIYVYTSAKCDSVLSWGVATSTSTRSVATIIFLEKGGFLCQNN